MKRRVGPGAFKSAREVVFHRVAVAVVSAVQVGLLLLAAGPVLAEGDGWQNADGTSKTATGHASTNQPAKVFAFDTGKPVTSCTSPQGSCVAGQPDGAASFEVFATDPITSVSFAVTTTEPIACGTGLTFKASFDGSTYTSQPTLPSDNDCATPPPNPCAISNVSGYFEPVQSVWQDDPLDAKHHFPDKPGKRLVQNAPNDYTAELPMVLDKPTLIFGVDHSQASAPRDRDHVVITGTTTGTTQVKVAMLFSGTGTGATLPWATPVLGLIDLDGPCGPPHDFRISMHAGLGLPTPDEAPPFRFITTGPYTLTAELRRESGGATGIEVNVHGRTVATRMPTVAFTPMRLVNPGTTTCEAPQVDVQTASDRLADDSFYNIPDFFPLKPGGLPALKTKLIDARAAVAEALDSWSAWAKKNVGLTTDARTAEDVLLASLKSSTQLGGTLGKLDRSVVVLNPCDIVALGSLVSVPFVGLAISQKVVLVQNGTDYWVVAHELAHTLPYSWSSPQMTSQCDIDFHNSGSDRIADDIAHGFHVTRLGFEDRAPRNAVHSVMGTYPGHQWIDQCTYWNLVNVLQNPPDPRVLLVRGRLARNGPATAGELLPAYELDGVVDLQAGGTGDWAIVTRDATGAEVARYAFAPEWTVPDLGRDLSVTSFGFRIPANSRVTRVDLVGPGGQADTMRWSSHAPSVGIIGPRTNSVAKPAGGKIHVTWTARDSDGDRLLATVLYSSDGGRTYQAQSVEQSGSSFDVSVGSGVSHRIRVVVTDGARSTASEIAISSETPAELVGRIASAYRGGTGASLVGRLDSAVIARYGTARCTSFLKSVHEPTLKYTVVSQAGPAPWTWESDGRSTKIPTVYSLVVTRTLDSRSTRISIHVAIRSGRLSFFADCGRPL